MNKLHMSPENRSNFNFQILTVLVGAILFGIKVVAWYLTNSVAILTDALESIVNILAGSFTLYSLYLSSIPKDRNHPYGHGKIEFISAGVEGTLILIAGGFILFEAFKRLFIGGADLDQLLSQLNAGLILVGITGIINYLVGYIAVRKGNNTNSIALIAGGKHLQSDAYSTAGLMLGLLLILFTKQIWIDAVIALIFGCIIIYTGLKIVRASVAGIMDEADDELIESLVNEVSLHRQDTWIDLHDVRLVKYGSKLHLDCHLTVPWYFTVREGHQILDDFEQSLKKKFGKDLDITAHADDCLPASCKICPLQNCAHRQHEMVEKLEWNRKLITLNRRHTIKDRALVIQSRSEKDKVDTQKPLMD